MCRQPQLPCGVMVAGSLYGWLSMDGTGGMSVPWPGVASPSSVGLGPDSEEFSRAGALGRAAGPAEGGAAAGGAPV
jgi:hypothetical protein